MNEGINTHKTNLRDEAAKIIETDNPRDLVEASLAMCIQHVTVTIGLLGSPVAVMTLPSTLIQSTQKQLLEAQLALVAELQDLTTRAANGLTTRSDNTKGDPEK
nr:MAG TPA: hypothetical protein [Caudoviricetes sp.]